MVSETTRSVVVPKIASASAVSMSSGFRPDIEGLRGIAVLLVVLYHAGVPGLSGGFVGVDVFFVLSGYLITGLLVKEVEATGTIDLLQFYARRGRRLLPAATLMLLVVTLAGMFVFAPVEQERIAQSAVATSVYLSNLWFLSNAADYFAADSETNPLLHTWSLAVEEQFYLVWPLLVLLALRGRSRRVLLGVMLLVTVTSFVSAVWLTEVHQPWAFFGSPARAWEFAVGGAAALLPFGALGGRRWLGTSLGWLGVLTVLGAAASFSKATTFPGAAALLPVLGTTAALVAGASAPAAGVGRLLALAPLQQLGRLSYGWYLWHWPALVFAAALFPDLPLSTRVGVALAALGVAAVTYHGFENPIRFHRGLSARPRHSLVFAVFTTIVCLGTAQGWLRVAWRLGNHPGQAAYTAARQAQPGVYSKPCDPSPSTSEVLECVFGDSTSQTTVVLFGDSHAGHWFPALQRLAIQRGVRLVTMLRSSCPVADVTVRSKVLQRDYVECDAWREEAIDRIIALQPAAVVAGTAMGYGEGLDDEMGGTQAEFLKWEQGYRRTFAALDEAGISAWLIRDNPSAEFDVLTCLSRSAMIVHRWLGANDCTFPRDAVPSESGFEMAQAGVRGLRHVSILDLSDQFCDDTVCFAEREGAVIYKDSNHITVTFAEAMTAVLEERMRFAMVRQNATPGS